MRHESETRLLESGNIIRLVILTRYPTAGEAKTRLIPLLGSDGAANVHRKLTERSVQILQNAAQQSQQQSKLELHYTGHDEAAFAAWLGKDICYYAQKEGGLTERLNAAISPAPVIFFGSDTPELSSDIICEAIDALSTHDVVIGPAEDGGYYLIGMKDEYTFLLNDMEWSTQHVYKKTIQRVEKADLNMHILPMLNDCDRPEDVQKYPWLMQ